MDIVTFLPSSTPNLPPRISSSISLLHYWLHFHNSPIVEFSTLEKHLPQNLSKNFLFDFQESVPKTFVKEWLSVICSKENLSQTPVKKHLSKTLVKNTLVKKTLSKITFQKTLFKEWFSGICSKENLSTTCSKIAFQKTLSKETLFLSSKNTFQRIVFR